jgi:hypothetical protein
MTARTRIAIAFQQLRVNAMRFVERRLRRNGYSIVPFTARIVMIRNGTSLYELDLSRPVGHKILQVTGGVYDREAS